jgi:hypothetical protein
MSNAERKPETPASPSSQPVEAGEGEAQVAEHSTKEPKIATPREDADRAQHRLEEQAGDHRWPQAKDPLRQPGELSPDPEKRRE